MGRKEDKEAFEEAIKEDPYNQATRLIFADWLNENNFDDEAEIQRSWTREKQEAEDYLRDFASKLSRKNAYDYEENDPYYEPEYAIPHVTYEEMIATIKNGDSVFLPFDTPDFVYQERERFMKYFAIVAGKVTTDEEDDFDLGFMPFHCAC
jgi:uncharacterized protein (TIGR02996 family)